MENQEDYNAMDSKIHITPEKEVIFMGEKLEEAFEQSNFINEILANPDEFEDENVNSLNLKKDDLLISIVAVAEQENEEFYIAVKGDDDYKVYLFDAVNNPIQERKPTPCWSYNVIDRRPKSKPHIISQIETFFHNFWYCPNHL